MFRKTLTATSTESISAREAKAFRSALADPATCAKKFPHIAGTAARVEAIVNPTATDVDLCDVLGALVEGLVPPSASVCVTVAAFPSFALRPGATIGDGIEGGASASSAALLMVDGVPLGFKPLQETVVKQRQAPAPAAKGGKGAKGKGASTQPLATAATAVKTLNASTVALPSLHSDEPWAPTVFLMARAEAVLHRARLEAAALAASLEAPTSTPDVGGSSLVRKLSTVAVLPQLGASASTVIPSLPPFAMPSATDGRPLASQPAVWLVCPATESVLRGADVMQAGVRGAPAAGAYAAVAAIGNPVPFAVGVPWNEGGKSVRVLHAFGDALWTVFFEAFAVSMRRSRQSLLVAPVTPLGVATLLGKLPCVATGGLSKPVSGDAAADDPVGSGSDEEVGPKKRKKHVPARLQKQVPKGGGKKGGKKGAEAAEENNEDDIPQAVSESKTQTSAAVTLAMRFLQSGIIPLGFDAAVIRPLPQAPHHSSASKMAAEHNEEADYTSAGDDDDDDAAQLAGLLEPESEQDASAAEGEEYASDSESVSVASSDHLAADEGDGARRGTVAWETVELPATPDAAVAFAVCEAALRLTKSELPIPVASFVPQFLLPCLPPTYWDPVGFDWAWTTSRKPLACLQESLPAGLITIGDAPTAAAAVAVTTSSGNAGQQASGGRVHAVLKLDRSHPAVRAHRRAYHDSGYFRRNGIVLQIDRGSAGGEGAKSLAELALAVGARRVERVRNVLYIPGSGLCDAAATVATFVPTPEHGDRLAEEGASLDPIDTAPRARINFAAMRKRLTLYARAHRLIIRKGDDETHSRRQMTEVESKALRPGARKHASPGDVRLANAPVLQALAQRAAGSAGYRGEAFASPSTVLMAGMLRDAVSALSVEFADGSTIEHRDRSRWQITLEQRLVRNHWQTICHGLPYFGMEPERCASVWPALFACSVDTAPADAVGKPPVVIVYGRVRNRILSILTNTVGIPSDYVAFAGREVKAKKKRR